MPEVITFIYGPMDGAKHTLSGDKRPEAVDVATIPPVVVEDLDAPQTALDVEVTRHRYERGPGSKFIYKGAL